MLCCHTLQRACFPIQYPQQYYFNLVREDRTGIVAVDSSTQEVQLIWWFFLQGTTCSNVVHSCLSCFQIVGEVTARLDVTPASEAVYYLTCGCCSSRSAVIMTLCINYLNSTLPMRYLLTKLTKLTTPIHQVFMSDIAKHALGASL